MVKAVVGANWGDEGKGKITDMLAKEADIIIRFQGGANAGHTIVNDYGKFALHTLPSGVFYDHTTSIIGNGVALNLSLIHIWTIARRGCPCRSRCNRFYYVSGSLLCNHNTKSLCNTDCKVENQKHHRTGCTDCGKGILADAYKRQEDVPPMPAGGGMGMM